MVRIKRFGWMILSLLMVIVLSGCKNDVGFINARWIEDVSLTPVMTSNEQNTHPESLTLKDSELIKTLATAMNKSAKLSGDIDWGPEYELKLVYGDGYTEDYYIALGEELGHQGVFTTAENSSQGYTIPVKNSDQLRKLIYGTEQRVSNVQPKLRDASVTVTGPVTLSYNELYPVTSRGEFLKLQLVEGTYSEDWTTPGPFMGRNWSGQFELIVTDEQGNPLSSFSLNDHFTESLQFNDLFQIQFEDYNGDGDPDFTIGQYGTSNGNFYKLFTLREDNRIEELAIKPGSELFISSPKAYSIQLDKIDNNSFIKSYYDNSEGKQVEDTFQWDGTAFQKLDK